MGTKALTMLEPLRQGPPPTDAALASASASCTLPARYEAVREARQFTKSTLSRWGLDRHEEDITLVTSELVTNALRHAVPDGTPESDCGVRLHLERHRARLVCAVGDLSANGPVARAVDDFAAESGRGLFLVDSFSESWGWHPAPEPERGKVVWALFAL
ncbi:ATP-binding protein [Streptomyces physcomitrii]|uniref:ATP-binding protein n=1 Tax=Streptomyces physcomitrii TaxID=2724184 RepID=A0ABX1HBC9_9ACTN|nr:ATP-binding protein [Streptomyces physcomitrii]NKI44580.1 ATP-binding protein [Streptomyces physcomitrii]